MGRVVPFPDFYSGLAQVGRAAGFEPEGCRIVACIPNHTLVTQWTSHNFLNCLMQVRFLSSVLRTRSLEDRRWSSKPNYTGSNPVGCTKCALQA
jgi:hypothetical protein